MNQSIFQLIKSRQSIRTYSSEPIESEILDKIQEYIDNITNPFNRKVCIEILKPNNYQTNNTHFLHSYFLLNPTYTK